MIYLLSENLRFVFGLVYDCEVLVIVEQKRGSGNSDYGVVVVVFGSDFVIDVELDGSVGWFRVIWFLW